MRRHEAGAVEYVVISYRSNEKRSRHMPGRISKNPHHLAKDQELLLELPARVLHYDVTYTNLAQVRVGQ